MTPKIDAFQTARRGTLEEFREVAGRIDIGQVNESGESLLHEAIAYQNNEVALDLIARGVDINRQTKKGLTPLHYAASHGNFLIACALLDRDADLSLQDMHGNQPLWTAVLAARNDLSLVERLVKQSADPRHTNNYGKSPFSLATEMNDSQLLAIFQAGNKVSAACVAKVPQATKKEYWQAFEKTSLKVSSHEKNENISLRSDERPQAKAASRLYRSPSTTNHSCSVGNTRSALATDTLCRNMGN